MVLEKALEDFERRTVLVVGDAILDEYLEGECSRISPEAPVPVLRIESERQVLGGAANTAANIASLGGRPVLIALAGDDQAGTHMRRLASGLGIDFRGVADGRPTIRKTRLVGQRQQLLRIDCEDIREISAETEERALDLFTAALPSADAVVISDYAKGLLTQRLCRELIARARYAGRRIIVDPRPQHGPHYAGADYLTPNWKEGLGLLGKDERPSMAEAIRETGMALAEKFGSNILLTLGPHGMFFQSRDGRESFGLPTVAKEVFDVSGAGDTVVAAFALALAGGFPDRDAAVLANKAAGIVVGKFGTATLTREEILRHDEDEARQIPPEALVAFSRKWKGRRKRIVAVADRFASAAADILSLQEARRNGDLLVAGILQAPGDGEVGAWLQALRCVDFICPLEGMAAEAFFARLEPDLRWDLAAGGAEGAEEPPGRLASGA